MNGNQPTECNMKNEHVFVYGTLRRGGSNHHRMEGGRWLGEAHVSGRLYRVDWYPALVLDAEAGQVVGDLMVVDAEQLTQLDHYEGSEYRRVTAQVLTAEGESVEAWVWEWQQDAHGLQLIAGGDWLTVSPDSPGAARLRLAPRRKSKV